MRVLVLGGAGNFGARICRRLAQESALEIVATSRSGRSAAGLPVRVVALDLAAPSCAPDLAALSPGIVIHCAGPFQAQDYRVAGAALACGAHYLDLADGREFVARFAAANQHAALAARRCAISGASTLPALSSAVVDHLAPRFRRIDGIDIVIAPAQRAPRGTATTAAVLGYAGRGFPWLEEGVWRTAHGWQELRRVPLSFGTRLAAACDVPDLVLLPERYSGVRTVAFRAALEVPVQHLALWLLAGARRIGLALPLERHAARLNRLASRLDRFGSDCGGMRVRVCGEGGDGRRLVVTWELRADRNHGPEIPCMAAELLACRLAAGDGPPAGAAACMGFLSLSDFERELARWAIRTRIDEERH